MERNIRKTIIFGAFILIFLTGIIYIGLTNNRESIEYEIPSPEKVVRQYFEAWGNKDYANMYATISDGFKKIEPTASDLRSFKEYVALQGIREIEIKSIKETSNDSATATVNYEVEFLLSDNTKNQFQGAFTLKYKDADIIPGWKLIHPYGENIDTA